MTDHAELAPSAAARWMVCTASIGYTRGVEREDSEWSIDGSLAHEKLELWLRFGVPPTDGILYEHLEHAYEYALSLERRGYNVDFECKVRYNSNIWGTVDIRGRKGLSLAIGDYKHGYRPVEVYGNAQMLTYAVCDAKEAGKDYRDLELTIIQPRISHIDGPVRTWIPEDNGSVSTIEWHRINMELAVKEIYGPHPRFKAGRHCKFCPREGDCKVFANWVSTLVRGSPIYNEVADNAGDLI